MANQTKIKPDQTKSKWIKPIAPSMGGKAPQTDWSKNAN
jgi:hypothetical protein